MFGPTRRLIGHGGGNRADQPRGFDMLQELAGASFPRVVKRGGAAHLPVKRQRTEHGFAQVFIQKSGRAGALIAALLARIARNSGATSRPYRRRTLPRVRFAFASPVSVVLHLSR